jgi:hypothetical protein
VRPVFLLRIWSQDYICKAAASFTESPSCTQTQQSLLNC